MIVIAIGMAILATQAEPAWVEVTPSNGFAHAVLISEVDADASTRRVTIVSVAETAPNPASQNFTLKMGEVDCANRAVNINEIVVYWLDPDEPSIHLPIQPDGRQILDGSAEDRICQWPAWSSETPTTYRYASDFADAVRERAAP